MPLDYNVPVLMTTQEILDAEGINPVDLNTFDGFVKVVEKYNEKYKDKPLLRDLPDMFAMCFTNYKSVFRNYQDERRDFNNFQHFFPQCGIDLIDYNTNKIGIDKAKFKNIIDMMKPFYAGEGNESMALTSDIIDYIGLSYQEWLFHIDYTTINSPNFYSLRERLVTYNLTPLYFKYPNIENGLTAEVKKFAAIPKASKNQINAYNLLKILLSEDIQKESMSITWIPVLKSVIIPRADKEMRDYVKRDWATTSNYEELRSRYEEIISEQMDMLINVDSAKLVSRIPYREFLMEEMMPYFKDTKSFDDCYSRLVNKLELYASE
jgi:ABC-type glycerol-3-phosphate transport system substrate-binding protein